MNKKILVFMLLLIILTSHSLFSNQRTNEDILTNHKSLVSFQLTPTQVTSNGIMKYSTSNDVKVKGFRNMGIAGAVVFGTSFLVLAGGIAMYAYAYQTVANAISASSDMNNWFSAAANVVGLYYGGIALIAVGTAFAVLSLPVMIVGFALSSYFKNNVTAFIENRDKTALATGIAIKI